MQKNKEKLSNALKLISKLKLYNIKQTQHEMNIPADQKEVIKQLNSISNFNKKNKAFMDPTKPISLKKRKSSQSPKSRPSAVIPRNIATSNMKESSKKDKD